MSSLGTAVEMIRPTSWLGSIDLKDAFYSIPIREEDRKLLKFTWEGQLYQFTSLPNGLACAPYFFTKLLTPLFVEARLQGIQCFPYIDDIFVMGDTYQECLTSIAKLCEILDSAGLVIHPEKSSLTPSQELIFLGFHIDSVAMSITLTEAKVEKIESVIRELLETRVITIRNCAQIIGLMIAYTPAVDYGLAHTKKIEKCRNRALVGSKGNFDATMILSERAKEDLEWWLRNAKHGVRLIRSDLPDVRLFTDASLQGWGAYAEGISIGGRWHEEEVEHINVMELEAIYLGLLSFCREGGKHIHVSTDNTTAMAYVRKMGGVRSASCNEVAARIWEWAEVTKAWLTVSFLPGVLNVEADRASRVFRDNIEWSLNPKAFARICKFFGYPEIDLFASRKNAKCDIYVSLDLDPHSSYIDAFTLSWEGINAYAFPPFSLIGRVLKKAEEEKPDSLILVAPDWPSAHWYPRLLEKAKKKIKFGKKRSNIMTNPDYTERFPKGIGLIVLLL